MKNTKRIPRWNGRGKRRPFTLIELVVVIVILVTLASIATPMYMNYTKKAKFGAATTQVKMLKEALTGYKLDVGSYPDSLEGLIENTSSSEKWDGPYLDPPKIPLDPWGNEYVYVHPGEHGDFDLSSYGADGQSGGTGENADINSWE